MKILLISDDAYISTAIRSRMHIDQVGDGLSFISNASACKKLIILADDRCVRRDYLRIKAAYPDNVFIVRLCLSRKKNVRFPAYALADEVDTRRSAACFLNQLQRVIRRVESQKVFRSIPLRLTKAESMVMSFISRGTSVPEIAEVLSLSEKGVRSHCYSVARKYGFSSLTFFSTFMFSQHLQTAALQESSLSGRGTPETVPS